MKDEKEGITFVQRTTREITKAMCSLTDFLRFTGEDCSMFQDGTLPTLDTALWMSNGQVLFKFFEKPTVGNQVLNVMSVVILTTRGCTETSKLQ